MVSEAVLVALPPTLDTVMGPVLASSGTAAWIWVPEPVATTRRAELVNRTPPPRPDPVIVTTRPAQPRLGVNAAITGRTWNVSAPRRVPTGPSAVTSPTGWAPDTSGGTTATTRPEDN